MVFDLPRSETENELAWIWQVVGIWVILGEKAFGSEDFWITPDGTIAEYEPNDEKEWLGHYVVTAMNYIN
jgi:hypothetical protein